MNAHKSINNQNVDKWEYLAIDLLIKLQWASYWRRQVKVSNWQTRMKTNHVILMLSATTCIQLQGASYSMLLHN